MIRNSFATPMMLRSGGGVHQKVTKFEPTVEEELLAMEIDREADEKEWADVMAEYEDEENY